MKIIRTRYVSTAVMLCVVLCNSGCALVVGAAGLGAGYIVGKKTIQTSKNTEQYVSEAERYYAPGVPAPAQRYDDNASRRQPLLYDTTRPGQPAYPPR